MSECLLWVYVQFLFVYITVLKCDRLHKILGLVEAPPHPPPPPIILLLAVPRRFFCFGSLVVLDVVFRYLSLCLLYINTKIGKNRCLMLD